MSNEITEKAQVINIKDNTILIFKINGYIEVERHKELKDKLIEQTGCRCLLLGDGIELSKVLNKE